MKIESIFPKFNKYRVEFAVISVAIFMTIFFAGIYRIGGPIQEWQIYNPGHVFMWLVHSIPFIILSFMTARWAIKKNEFNLKEFACRVLGVVFVYVYYLHAISSLISGVESGQVPPVGAYPYLMFMPFLIPALYWGGYLIAMAIFDSIHAGRKSMAFMFCLVGVVLIGYFPIKNLFSESRIGALTRELSDSNSPTRERAAAALGGEGVVAKSAVPGLIKALADSDPKVRETAADALGRIGPDAKSAVPELIKTLNDSHSWVRITAAYTLGRIGHDAKHAIPELTKVLRDSHAWVREAAIWSLMQMLPESKSAIPELKKLLDDPNKRVRGSAVAALAKMDSQKTVNGR